MASRLDSIRGLLSPARKRLNALAGKGTKRSSAKGRKKKRQSPLERLQALWKEHKRPVMAAGVGLACLLLLLGYMLVKRPDDILDPDAPFAADQFEVSNDWPTYGYDNQRTRYLPGNGVEPPFKRLWRYGAGTLLEFSPIYYNGKIYGVNNDGVAFSLNADNGYERWRKRLARLNASSPTFYKGRLFIATLDPGQIIALDATSGRERWKRDLPARSESSPLAVDNHVYFGLENGELWAVHFLTGETVWKQSLSGEVKAAPAYRNGIIYVGDYSGEMWAIRAADGSVKWRASDQGQSFGRGGRFYATPAVAFGRVYVGNVDGRMYSYVQETGELAWTHSTGHWVYSSPVAAETDRTDPTVYFGSHDGRIYALDARTGEERWSVPAGGAISGAPSLIGEILYFANIANTETWGVDARTGERVFRSEAGAYNPVISDGRRIYLTGYSVIQALEPTAPQGAGRGRQADEAAAEGAGEDGQRWRLSWPLAG